MLSYQHGYHAGNFADVIKHMALNRLLVYLTIKESPLFYLETHAGKGIYDLRDKQAAKTQEYKEGIGLLWPKRLELPELFNTYIQLIDKLQAHLPSQSQGMEVDSSNTLRYYPGSPYFAINLLRSQDRLYLCELHPQEFEALNLMPHFLKKVHVEQTDGIASFKALLPPKEKRGLVFIDPSYELKEEYKQIPAAIKQVFYHFSNGVFCLWYPLINQRLRDQLDRGMRSIGAKNALQVEFNLNASKEGMTGCGLWVINPPYTFADEMHAVCKLLKAYFNPGHSTYTIQTL